MVKVKRIYEPVEAADGFRILVDRLWPRGIKKETAQIDWWLKEIAPSTALRKWFHHDPDKWPEFQKAYKKELMMSDKLQDLIDTVKKYKKATLLYAASDKLHNHALILEKYINKKLS